MGGREGGTAHHSSRMTLLNIPAPSWRMGVRSKRSEHSSLRLNFPMWRGSKAETTRV